MRSALPGAIAALSFLLLLPQRCAPEGKADDKVQNLKCETKQKTEGAYLEFEGATQYPDGVVLSCGLQYFGRPVPGASRFARVKKGRFGTTIGPVQKPFLPGTYHATVRFVTEDQAPELMYKLQDESDASFASDVQVGTDADVQQIEKKYQEALSALLDSAERRVKDLDSAYDEAEAGKRWHKSDGPDVDACIAFTQDNEQGYRHDLEALKPFTEAAAEYRPETTDILKAFMDALHLITCVQVKGLFGGWGRPVPNAWKAVGFDTPLPVLEKQTVGEALQPVRDYLHPPASKDEKKDNK